MQYSAAVKTQVAVLPTSTITPTVTPTMTMIAEHVQQGSTRRTTVFGNSWACGYKCFAGGCSEGWLPALIAAQPGIYMVGVIAVANPTPNLTPGAYTCAFGGTSEDAIVSIRANLASLYPSPASTDVILLGPLLGNDFKVPGMDTLAAMTGHMYTAITETAARNNQARIGVMTDLSFLPYFGYDNAMMHQAALDAYNLAVSNGFTRVFFVNAYGCLTDADYCNGDGHVYALSNNKLGGCIAAQIPAP